MTTAPLTAPAPSSAAPVSRSAATTVEVLAPQGWVALCALDALVPGRGVAALLPDGAQIALFRDRAGRAYAIGNRDPFTGAYVLSRGLTGSADDRPFVSSPLLKQRFDLASGGCLDDPDVSVPAYRVRTRSADRPAR